MVKQVIIIGGHIQALGLARQAANLGMTVVLFVEDGYSVARFSNSVKNTVVFGNVEQLKEKLACYRDSGTLLFPTADDYVEFLAANFKELSMHFVLGIPNPEIVTLFGDKRKTYQFAEQAGIPHPKSWYPDTLDDVEHIADKITYPVVIKPGVMYSFHKMFGKKAFRCDSKEELVNRCTEISKKMPINSLVVQEFLSGGAKSLFSYGAFAVNGEPKAWVMANRIRQNPMDFGNSTTFAVTCDIPAIEQSARRILKDTKYTGLAEVEYMYDDKSGTYKFLEINTRAWKWHSISMGLGFGFLSEMIYYMNGEKGIFHPSTKEMAWVERLTDYTIIAKETIKGRMNLSDALRTYCQQKVSAVWSWKDPMPALMYLILSPVLYVKRY